VEDDLADDTTARPEVRITLFTDFICPFCFIGDLRLQRLREEYSVLVNFRFLEIHPETPAAGMQVEALDYDESQWSDMMSGLAELAEQEGITLRPLRRLCNSHAALLLAEAAKQAGRDPFYALNRALFEAYFLDAQDISDHALLRGLAKQAGIAEQLVEAAWSEDSYARTLSYNMQLARQAGVSGTPTFFIGQQRLVGAVPLSSLQAAAAQSLADRGKGS
jgi:predicted DsbA family dithiol-disulfide isomerase